MDVIDTMLAAHLELPTEHDDTPCQIIWQNDPIEVDFILDEGDVVMVKGFSHMTGDRVVYLIPATADVEIWAI